jgi:hypothetical protein
MTTTSFYAKTLGEPVTLKALREIAKLDDDAARHCSGDPADFLRSLDFLDWFGIEYKIFRTSTGANCGSEDPFLPADVDPLTKQGMGVDIDGVQYVVLENNQNPGVHEMTVAPRHKENR